MERITEDDVRLAWEAVTDAENGGTEEDVRMAVQRAKTLLAAFTEQEE